MGGCESEKGKEGAGRVGVFFPLPSLTLRMDSKRSSVISDPRLPMRRPQTKPACACVREGTTGREERFEGGAGGQRGGGGKQEWVQEEQRATARVQGEGGTLRERGMPSGSHPPPA